MSQATKRKHVIKEVLDDDLTVPTEQQEIVRVLSSRGNNLHEVESPDGSSFLVSMPSKFRKNVWVKKGDFILVEPITEGDKVKAEMVKVLTRTYIKFLKKERIWPQQFEKSEDKDEASCDYSFVNTNRRPCEVETESSESE